MLQIAVSGDSGLAALLVFRFWTFFRHEEFIS